MSQPWTVVIADDDAPSRKDLSLAIDTHPRFRIIGEAADGLMMIGQPAGSAVGNVG